MAILLARVVLIAALAAAPATAFAQTAPNLSKDQRQTLLTLVNNVKAAADQPADRRGLAGAPAARLRRLALRGFLRGCSRGADREHSAGRVRAAGASRHRNRHQ